MKCLIAEKADSCPEAPYLWEGGLRLSFAECHNRISLINSVIGEHGIRSGDTVIVLCRASIRSALLLHALFRTGATAFPLNPATPPAELARLSALTRAKYCVIDDLPIHAGMGIKHGLALKEIVSLSAAVSAKARASVKIDCSSNATFMLTSGSSGNPKVVVHGYCQHVKSAASCNANIPLGRGDRWLLNLPLWHVSGLSILFRCASASATAIILKDKHEIEKIIHRKKITHVSMVSTQLYRLLENASESVMKLPLKALLLGGGPIHSSLVDKGRAAGLPLLTSYGSTETASQICATRPGAGRNDLVTAGYPLKNQFVMLAPDGEILVKGPTLAKGILEPEGKLSALVDGKGWFHTGDMGRMDRMGRLTVTGRKDNMFISGGENIHPEEIESAMLNIFDLAAAIVVPLPHPEFGARPVAFLKPIKGKTLPHLQEIKKTLSPYLSPYKIPDYLLDWPEKMAIEIKPPRKKLQKIAQRSLKNKISNTK